MRTAAVLFFLIPAFCTGQSKIELGAATGANQFFIRGNDMAESLATRTGLSAELSARYSLNKFFTRTAIQFDERSVYRSWYGLLTTSGHYVNNHTQLTYQNIAVPLIAGIQIGKTFRISLGAGGYASYLLSTKQRNISEMWNVSRDVTIHYKKWEFGIIAELGFTLFLNNRLGLHLALSDVYGLSDISKSGTINNKGLRTNTPRALAGIQFVIN